MQTRFSLTQLADPDIAVAEKILRNCVHCGFCTATCPTYVVRGDELDSPRGRIYQIRDYLEDETRLSKGFVTHIDRCLSCLSCMTTCPSSVDYAHLVHITRKKLDKTQYRPLMYRLKRHVLAWLLPSPVKFRFAIFMAVLCRPVLKMGENLSVLRDIKPFLKMIPDQYIPPSWSSRKMTYPALAGGSNRRRVALHIGCAQQILDPAINEATIRFLNRHGIEVVVASEHSCCGALTHHMGKEEKGREAARNNLKHWQQDVLAGKLDAIITNASGCGTMLKEYGALLQDDPIYASLAQKVSELSCDISQIADQLDLQMRPEGSPVAGLAIAYHSACSMQHGLKLKNPPLSLLQKLSADIRPVKEAHLCCGSAGTYNLLQPDLATSLQKRKQKALLATGAKIVVAGNIGCLVQIASDCELVTVHLIQLLDWATGGDKPSQLNEL